MTLSWLAVGGIANFSCCVIPVLVTGISTSTLPRLIPVTSTGMTWGESDTASPRTFNQGGESMTILLDPTSESTPASRQRLARPDSLEGLTVGLLDISKPRGDVFLDRLDERLSGMGITVKRYMKPTVAKPAPLAVYQQIALEANLVIEGLAD